MVEVTQLHLSYRRQLDRLRLSTVVAARLISTSDFATWRTEIVDLVLGSQRTAVSLADAYLSTEAGLATDTAIDPWGIDPERLIGAHARRGALLEDVYGRQFVNTVGSLAFRVTREVNTDITLAERSATFVHTAGDPRIVGYKRVLGSGPNCALCVVASTRTYRSADLRPIHSHCGCTSAPIYTPHAPPQVDKAFLNDLYQRAGANTYGGLRRLSVDDSELPSNIRPQTLPPVQVTDDSEIGPALVRA